MCSNMAYKYRMYPNSLQQEFFMKSFGCCRKVWNLMLQDLNDSLKNSGTYVFHTPAEYKNTYFYLKEVDSLALANVQLDFKDAVNRYRKKISKFPKFKSRNKSRFSYTTNNQNGTVHIKDNHIKLPKIGYVKIVKHRDVPADWRLKSATVSMERDGSFYVSVLYEYEKVFISHPIVNGIGLDYSSKHLYVDSNGNKCSMVKSYRNSEEKLSKEQHRLSRKVYNSKNYLKQQRTVAKCHRHVSNVRKDFLHKESFEIANRWKNVCIESLHIRSMSNKGFGNGKSTLDNGFGMFVNFLEYKLFIRGKELVKVDKYYASSQLCNHCGYKNPLLKDLRIRSWACPVCGVHHDRDINAAINILQEGLHILSKRREEKLKEREEAKQLNKK